MPKSLLAIDLGLKTGLALYGEDGRLVWYRSSNVGSRGRLRKAAASVLQEAEAVQVLVIEGGGDLAAPWVAEAERRNLTVVQLSAEAWRKELLLSRHQRSAEDAKKHADALARQLIAWSGAKRPTSLRHDAAEAICIGFWGVLKMQWLTDVPPALRNQIALPK